MHHTLRHWRHQPELRLLGLALPLELAWEGAQLPLYTLLHEHDWGYILFSLAHCTAGDLLILLACYVLIALWRATASGFSVESI